MTPVIDAPEIVPVVVSVKSLVSTHVTDSLNGTVQETLVAFVGVEPTRAIVPTVGGVVSTVTWTLLARPVLPAASLCCAFRVYVPEPSVGESVALQFTNASQATVPVLAAEAHLVPAGIGSERAQ